MDYSFLRDRNNLFNLFCTLPLYPDQIMTAKHSFSIYNVSSAVLSAYIDYLI